MKYFKILLILCLSVILSSCSNNSTNSSVDTQNNSTQKTATEDAPIEDVEKKEELSGIGLLDTIESTIPESYILEMKTTISDSITTTFKMTVMGDFSKIETFNNMSEVPMVILYNPDLNAMFQYTLGDSFGMKFEGMEDSTGDMFWDDSNDLSNLKLDEIKESFASGFIARKENYKGHDTIYIEGSFSESEESGTIKMWYSQDFFLPIKYEIYNGDTLVMTSEIITFDKNPKLTSEDFLPPKNMEFQDLNMDMMQQ